MPWSGPAGSPDATAVVELAKGVSRHLAAATAANAAAASFPPTSSGGSSVVSSANEAAVPASDASVKSARSQVDPSLAAFAAVAVAVAASSSPPSPASSSSSSPTPAAAPVTADVEDSVGLSIDESFAR